MKKFVARHPILDQDQKVFGYELLFRSGLESYFRHDQPDRATSEVVVDSFLLFGMQSLTGGSRAFINFTHTLLAGQYVTLLPKQELVVEILENVEPDRKLVKACEELKSRGYLLALDDFVPTENQKPLIELADFIKVDFLATSADDCRHLAYEYGARGITMVAEKVETREQFAEAVEMGYSLFQGFFFSKPEVVAGRDVPAFKMNYLWLMKAINRPDPDFAEIELVIRRETSLCYKLLRYLNSASFGLTREISSIRHALSLLGLQEVRKWTSLVALAGMGEDKPAALIIASMIRARFCEAIAPTVGLANRSNDFFLTGLLSLMDAILERPMRDILEELPLAGDTKSALLGEKNVFWAVLEFVRAYERGDWQRTARIAGVLRMNEAPIAEAYLQSVCWAHDIFRMEEAEQSVESPL